MTSQPDKLFRDKLENFQRPAPAGAWDKIEDNLTKRNRKIVWLRVAAGIALLCAAAIVLWPADEGKEKITQTENKNSLSPQDTIKEPILNKKAEKKDSTPDPVTPPMKKYPTPVAKIEKPVQRVIPSVQDSVEIIPLNGNEKLIAEVTVPEEQNSSRKIVYTSDEVNSKFLKKKLPPEATPDNKEASGIQKLIGLAYAAKNSDAPLANLRQKKDDILALNFGKKKGEN